jgi:hypothetical protein
LLALPAAAAVVHRRHLRLVQLRQHLQVAVLLLQLAMLVLLLHPWVV